MTQKNKTQSSKISRRGFLKTSALVAAGAALAACTPAATEKPPEVKPTEAPKPTSVPPTAAPTVKPTSLPPTAAPTVMKAVTIKVLIPDDAMKGFLQTCAAQYTKLHPEVNFEWNIMAMEQLRLIQLPIMTGSETPDLVYINFGSGLTESLVKAKAIVNMDPYYAKYGWWKFLPDHLHTHEYNGSMYHTSVSANTAPLMYYNKPTMEKVGGPPKDLPGLFTFADRCHAAGLEAQSMGDRDQWPGFHLYQALAIRTVPLKDYENILHFDKKEYPFFMKDYPGFAEAFQILRDMQTKKVFAPGIMDMDNAGGNALFATGKAVIWGGTPSWIPANRTAFKENLDFFLYPQFKSNIPAPATVSYSHEYLISSKSKIPDVVAEFCNYLLSKEGMKAVAGMGVPPIRTDMTAKDLEGVGDPLTGKVSEIFNGSRPVTDEILTFWPPELGKLLYVDTQAAILGTKTPEQCVKDFDTMAAEFRAKV